MNFEGEHLLPGKLGHFFVLLAFVSAIVSAIAYFISIRFADDIERKKWISFARVSFGVQVFSILSVFALIYYICSHHYFEYLYAYKHASKELEPKYLLACIWEGQEGSFLLWSIWHAVLGGVLIFSAKQREAPVMAVINIAQCILLLMTIGIYIGDVRIGSSAFVLTRNEINGPIFNRPDYLSLIKDGVGLNVLLRNYWMVIHPPVLFLGFASTLVPVAFAFSSLRSKQFGTWIKPALPWTLFSGCVLAVGIMMGGKWAYESLSFGGYWAWDPVENAALVPWLILISGLHCMAIYNATGTALRASYLFIILSYFFVLYSTFLTRTGILGDTSVHSFTEAGLAMNVLIGLYVIAIPLPLLLMYFSNLRKIPAVQKEEDLTSREFWMFIGALIFFLSALFIIALTSLPVYNKIFGTSLADPEDREFAYNKVLVLVAFLIGLFTAFSQYFKYRNTSRQYLLKKIAWPASISLVVCILLLIFYPIQYVKKGPGFMVAIYAALYTSLFSLIANAAYLQTVLKGKLKAGGGAIAHAGFTMMIAGMLISSGNKEVISDNRKTGIFVPFDKDPTGRSTENPLENLTLVKSVPTPMGKYTVTYVNDSAAEEEKTRTFYNLHFLQTDAATGTVKEEFFLSPDAYRMKDNNLSSNPGTRHYFTHDVFTYISTISIPDAAADTAQYHVKELGIGDTSFFSKGFFVLNDILKNPDNERLHYKATDTAMFADITVYGPDSSRHKAYPGLAFSNGSVNFVNDSIVSANLYLSLSGITDQQKFKIGVKESDKPIDFITLKAYVFPYINFVWAGLIIMACGFIISMTRRLKAANYLTLLSVLLVLASLFYMFFIANN
jgi:cytochrome c-type biogenesis protein CcmF